MIGEYTIMIQCDNTISSANTTVNITILGTINEVKFADPNDPIHVVKTNDNQIVNVVTDGKLDSYLFIVFSCSCS